jgi:hypothetical protein
MKHGKEDYVGSGFSHSSDFEEYYFLECDAMQSRRNSTGMDV